jgi:hypothetical protein
MKIYNELFPVRDIKNGEKSIKKTGESEKPVSKEDKFTLTNDKRLLVMEENRSAAEADISDLKKAEEELKALTNNILNDRHTASEIHRVSGKRVLYLALDN